MLNIFKVDQTNGPKERTWSYERFNQQVTEKMTPVHYLIFDETHPQRGRNGLTYQV